MGKKSGQLNGRDIKHLMLLLAKGEIMLEERLQRWSTIITRYGFRKCIHVLCSSVWTLKRSAEQLNFKSIRRVAAFRVVMLMNEIRADLKGER